MRIRTHDVINSRSHRCTTRGAVDVVTVRETGDHWEVTVRLKARDGVEFEVLKGTPAQTRQRLVDL